MSGDFGKVQPTAILTRSSFVGGIFAGAKHNSNSHKNFFYTYYKPVMDHIIGEVLENRESAPEE